MPLAVKDYLSILEDIDMNRKVEERDAKGRDIKNRDVKGGDA